MRRELRDLFWIGVLFAAVLVPGLWRSGRLDDALKWIGGFG